ncbi:hypothetical protein DPMN_112430 [Dreissena polymorpha]|uniref:Uncharacterized protein n=1 Tax=Dreissena polymorpha TaxID=45954 RepID=A0A9D4QPR2_DREPO|nr:hypothetical protein DPMN_112430 [Dreissena polymorpha]
MIIDALIRTIYEQCRETAATELTELTQAIDMFNSEEPMLILQNLKDSRKKSYKAGIKRIEKTIATRLENWFKTDL